MIRQDDPLFAIRVAASMLEVHPQTLRLYERLGFVVPHRTKGRTRLYSQKNIDQVRFILTLTRRYRVNLAGVKFILQLQYQIDDTRYDTQDLINRIRKSKEGERIGLSTHANKRQPTRSRSPAIKIKVERG